MHQLLLLLFLLPVLNLDHRLKINHWLLSRSGFLSVHPINIVLSCLLSICVPRLLFISDKTALPRHHWTLGSTEAEPSSPPSMRGVHSSRNGRSRGQLSLM